MRSDSLYWQQQNQTSSSHKATIFVAVAAVAGFAATLVVLRDAVDINVLLGMEAILVLIILLLVLFGLFGEQIGKWRDNRYREYRWRKAMRENWTDFATVVEHLGWFIGDMKHTEATLSRVYENLRQKPNFIPMQNFPNETNLHSMQYKLQQRVNRFEGSVKEFQTCCDDLSELLDVYLSFVTGAVTMLRWLGPNRDMQVEKLIKEAGIAALPKSWSQYFEIDQTTQDNYQVFREGLNAFLEDYKNLATRLEKETGDRVLRYPTTVPAKI